MGSSIFLLTRFYVRIKNEAELPGEDWLRLRLPQFENVCLPSVQVQSLQNFSWLVFIDAQAPSWLQGYLTRCLPHNSEVVLVDGPCTRDAIAAAVLSRSSGSSVITCRVDNDDALHSDYIAHVSNRLSEESFSFLNFQNGYQLSRERLLAYSHPSNAFIALIEPRRDDLRTVFVDWHDRVAKHGPVIQVTGYRAWVQNCHGRNVRNQERGIRANLKTATQRFPTLKLRRQRPIEFSADVAGSAVRTVGAVLRRPKRLLRLVGRS